MTCVRKRGGQWRRGRGPDLLTIYPEWTLWTYFTELLRDFNGIICVKPLFSTVPTTQKNSHNCYLLSIFYCYHHLGFKDKMMWTPWRRLCSDQNWLLRELNSQPWFPQYSILSPKKVPILYLHTYRGENVLFKNWPCFSQTIVSVMKVLSPYSLGTGVFWDIWFKFQLWNPIEFHWIPMLLQCIRIWVLMSIPCSRPQDSK